MGNKVVIFGANEMAMMSHFYLSHDSSHEVVAFTVDREFIKEESFCGLPVVPFEDIESLYPPDDHKMLVAIMFGRLNRTRAEKYSQVKAKGYKLISYISSKAMTWPGLEVGDNTIILEGSVIGPFAQIGNNVIVSGSFVAHHAIIKDHCFIGAHATILGCVEIEPYCFIGANSTIQQWVVVARECIIGAGSIINKNTPERAVFVSKPAELMDKPSNLLNTWLTWPSKVRQA
jgi:sugar O-acyltransferase (sialic acid O-acetyltransferase NeuD family)